jgi:hypothetical protein
MDIGGEHLRSALHNKSSSVEGASYVSGPQFFGTVTVAPFTQLAPLVGFNGGGSVWPGGNFATEAAWAGDPARG